MTSELAIANRDAAIIRYDKELAVYQAIFGEDTVWCRAIPHIEKKPVVVVIK